MIKPIKRLPSDEAERKFLQKVGNQIKNRRYTLPDDGRLTLKDVFYALLDIPNKHDESVEDLLEVIKVYYQSNPDIHRVAKNFLELLKHSKKGIVAFTGRSEFSVIEAAKWCKQNNIGLPEELDVYIPREDGRFTLKDILFAYFNLSVREDISIKDTPQYIGLYCKLVKTACYEEAKELYSLLTHKELGIGKPANGFWYSKIEMYEWFIKTIQAGYKFYIPEVFIPKSISPEHYRDNTPQPKIKATNSTKLKGEVSDIERLVKDRKINLDSKQLTYETPQQKTKKRFKSNSRILIAAAWIYTGMYKDQRFGGGNDAIKKAIPVVDKLYGLNLLRNSDVAGFRIIQGDKTILFPRNDNKRIEESLSDIRNSHQDYITKIIKISKNPEKVQAYIK